MKDNKISYYEQPELWGNKPRGAELERVNAIISKIPAGTKTILEVGCGDGVLINRLQKKGFNCTGIDVSKEALSHVVCKKHLMSSDRLNFNDKSFDMILCSEVLEHLPVNTYEKTLKELERVSREYILITTPYKEFLRASFTKCNYCATTYHIYKHIRWFDEIKFRNLFNRFKLKELFYMSVCKKLNYIDILLRYRLGNFYINSNHGICPACFFKNNHKRRYNLFSMAAALLFRIIPHKKQAHWIGGLFVKTGHLF